MTKKPHPIEVFMAESEREAADIAKLFMDALEEYKPGESKNAAAVAYACMAVAGSCVNGIPRDLREVLMPAWIEAFKEYAGTQEN